MVLLGSAAQSSQHETVYYQSENPCALKTEVNG